MSKPILALFQISPADSEDVDRWFTYLPEPGTIKQIQAAESITQAGKLLALAILRNMPRCADRSSAVRKVREAVNSAIDGVMHESAHYEAKVE